MRRGARVQQTDKPLATGALCCLRSEKADVCVEGGSEGRKAGAPRGIRNAAAAARRHLPFPFPAISTTQSRRVRHDRQHAAASHWGEGEEKGKLDEGNKCVHTRTAVRPVAKCDASQPPSSGSSPPPPLGKERRIRAFWWPRIRLRYGDELRRRRVARRRLRLVHGAARHKPKKQW